MAISQRRSASVTGDLSALMRTSMLCWNSDRAMTAARSAASRAACSSGEGFMGATLANLVLPLHPQEGGLGTMGNRLSKIYTRTGDDGSTGLGDGSRVPKEDLRVEAYGTVDETNSAIGVVLSVVGLPPAIASCLTEIQHDLFDLGGELCIPGHRMIEAAHVERLETELDSFNEDLPPLKEFILPGGGPAAAACHIARAVCRRAERRCCRLRALRMSHPSRSST